MRILIVGGAGTVGKAAATELGRRHEIVRAGRSSGDLTVDVMDEASVKAMYAKLGKVDAVVTCVGHVHFGPVATMTPEQFRKGLNDKLMGQVNLVLLGMDNVNDNGSFTLTSGVLDRDPVRAGANAAAVNGNAAGNDFSASVLPFILRGMPFGIHTDGLGWQRTKWSPLQRRYYRWSEWVSARLATGLVTDSIAMRDYYETAYRDFRWPEMDRFNWAIDWFDAELAQGANASRPALWITGAGADEITDARGDFLGGHGGKGGAQGVETTAYCKDG